MEMEFIYFVWFQWKKFIYMLFNSMVCAKLINIPFLFQMHKETWKRIIKFLR